MATGISCSLVQSIRARRSIDTTLARHSGGGRCSVVGVYATIEDLVRAEEVGKTYATLVPPPIPTAVLIAVLWWPESDPN